MKKPPPGQDQDKGADVVGELDFGLDSDPDLRTRPGQMSVLRREPKRRGGIGKWIVLVVLLGLAGAWIGGALETVGFPPPAALKGLLGGK